MSTEERILKLVQGLLAKTTSGEMAWERTSTSGVFQVAFPSYTVKLSIEPNNDNPDANDYFVWILDETGHIIERASDVELQRKFPTKRVVQLMDDLYSAARRHAMDVDGALDSLLSELSQ